MNQNEFNPQIRFGLDFFPLDHEGKKMICIRDPMGFAEEAVLVPPHTFYLIARMDSEHSVLDLQASFTRQFGQIIPRSQVLELVDTLDAKGFMDSPSFRDRLEEIRESFRQAPVREATLAGQAYPAERHEIAAMLDSLFVRAPSCKREESSGALVGIVAPHIDLHRGGALFASAYAGLREAPPPHTVLLFGTAHFGEGNLYILTKKDFETPLGRAEVNHEFCEALSIACSFDLTEGELAHKNEHSLEFQVLFLQHIYGSARMPKIVPILCTGLFDRLEPGTSPLAHPEVDSFMGAIQGASEQCPGPVLGIAGADLSHVGRKFGTPEALSDAFLQGVRKEDQEALSAVAAVDSEGFFEVVSRIQNRNNICSVTSIYTLLRMLEGASGQLLDYDMAVDHDTDSAVGFAALNFYG